MLMYPCARASLLFQCHSGGVNANFTISMGTQGVLRAHMLLSVQADFLVSHC